MNCGYCQTWNSEDEHRCARCGRRLRLPAGASLNYPVSRCAPALALEEEPSVYVEDVAVPSRRQAPVPQKLSFADSQSNVIPFESFAADRIQPLDQVNAHRSGQDSGTAGTRAAIEQTAIPPRIRHRPAAQADDDRQAGLDFLVAPPQGPRTLKTQVEAVIYCDADVARPKHRVIAAAIDGGMIFTGFGLFLFAFHLMGGIFHMTRQTIPLFIGVFATLAMFYGFLWIWSGRETAGMRWAGLCLVNFDGLPADGRDRVLRAVGACLSVCAGGIGLLWALVDEEKLAWHDHMSKTFPTPAGMHCSPFRKR